MLHNLRHEAASRPDVTPKFPWFRKRLRMTVCVGAIAAGGNAIVAALDQMLTVQTATADMPEFAKGMRIHPFWFAAYSGDPSQAPQILGRATDLLGRYRTPRVERVTDIFLKVYKDHRARVLKQGIGKFELDFLVAGFDINGAARLFTIEPPGVEHRWDNVGFWAVGIGAEPAINNLMLREYKTHQSLDDAVYQVAESKFVAEPQHGIGSKTAIVVMLADSSIALLTRHKSDAIREIWEAEGKPKMPDNLGSRITPLFNFVKAPVPTIRIRRKRKSKKR